MFKTGNAPCSWGVIENVAGKRTGWEKVLDEIAASGYKGTELGDWNFLPSDPSQLKDELQKRNLTLTGSWVNVYLSQPEKFEESLENCIKTAKLLSQVGDEKPTINLGDACYLDQVRTLNAGRAGVQHQMNDDQWDIFTKNADKICSIVEGEYGVKVLMHHHIGTFIETEAEIERLLNESTIDLCFDSGHCLFGACEPVSLLKKYYDRIGLVHLKDCNLDLARQSREQEWGAFESLKNGIFSLLGSGHVDFLKILQFLKEQSYNRWLVVEQDIITDSDVNPFENAKQNKLYIDQLIEKLT